MTHKDWPAWRWSADGKSDVFNGPEDVPEGWMTRDEFLALPPQEPAAEGVHGGEGASVNDDAVKASRDRLKAALMALDPEVLDAIEPEATVIDAAAAALGILDGDYKAMVAQLAEKSAALDLYVEAFHPGETWEEYKARKASEPAGADGSEGADLNGDGVVEPNREEIKKALDGLGVDYDGRIATDKLQALLTEAQAKAAA